MFSVVFVTQAATARFSLKFICCSPHKCCGCVTAVRMEYRSVLLASSSCSSIRHQPFFISLNCSCSCSSFSQTCNVEQEGRRGPSLETKGHVSCLELPSSRFSSTFLCFKSSVESCDTSLHFGIPCFGREKFHYYHHKTCDETSETQR